METAIGIKTEIWNNIIEYLTNNDWEIAYKYDNFDAGIDHDFLILKKGEEEILFGWDNWFEGEIQAKPERLKEIEQRHSIRFKKGEAENLNPKVVELHRGWRKMKFWKKK